jgi:predicted enzyme related to lactoylglutathione lyase
MFRQLTPAVVGFCLSLTCLYLPAVATAEQAVPPITVEPTHQMRPGKLVWADLLTTDVASAAQFYRDVFGWQMAANAKGDYVTASFDGTPVAAIASYEGVVPEGGQALWLVSIAVMDLDEALARVTENGGEIIEPAVDLPERGRLSLIKDPQGARLMLLRATGGDPEDSPPLDNTLLWGELWTRDVPAAVAFYEKLIGYRAVQIKGSAGRDYHVLGRDEKARASVIASPFPDVEPNWLPYLLVADVADAVKKVVLHGGSVYVPPQKDDLNYDIAIVADPTGGVFALQQRRGDE